MLENVKIYIEQMEKLVKVDKMDLIENLIHRNHITMVIDKLEPIYRHNMFADKRQTAGEYIIRLNAIYSNLVTMK